MNQRIKELIKPHLVHERFTRYGESCQEDYYEFYPNELEELVHTIVQECAQVARSHLLEKADRSHLVHRKILEHFGVEQ